MCTHVHGMSTDRAVDDGIAACSFVGMADFSDGCDDGVKLCWVYDKGGCCRCYSDNQVRMERES